MKHALLELLAPSWAPPAASLVLHVSLLLLLSVSLTREADPSRLASGVEPREVIEATVVDSAAIEAEMRRQEEAARQAQQAIDEQRRREQAAIDQARRERAAEEQRLAELERQRQQAADEARQAAAEAQAARDRQAQERAAADQAARERAAQEQAARDAALLRAQQEEAARLAAEQRAAEERAAEEAAQRRQQAEAEALLQQQLAAEARRQEVIAGGYLARYQTAVKQRVERNWIEPGEIPEGFYCEVVAQQIPGGEVVGVEFGTCNADEIWRRSLETAVLRSSPLPGPPPEAPEVFDRNLRLIFEPVGDGSP